MKTLVRPFATFRNENPEDEILALEQYRTLRETHPDRLLDTCPTTRASVLAYLHEARNRGYNILPADNPLRHMRGFVVYKEIEGIELAYNPVYPDSEEVIEEYNRGYIQGYS